AVAVGRDHRCHRRGPVQQAGRAGETRLRNPGGLPQRRGRVLAAVDQHRGREPVSTATSSRQGVRAAAAGYLERGWVPVPLRGKAPVPSGWQKLTRDGYDLGAMFPAGQPLNVGLLLGEPSGGLIDADLDCPDARAAAVVLLPETGMVWGRQSAPDSHYGYVVQDPPSKASDKFDDPLRSGKGTRLAELRSTGGQTVVVPSVYPADPEDGHPSAEPCVWSAGGDPSPVVLADLWRLLNRVAAAALLGRYW